MNLNLVEERGRVFIPADVSTQLAWSPGMRLVVKQAENGQMWLQPESPTVIEKEGVFVISAEPFDDLTNIVREERELRMSELLQRMGADESSI